MLNLTYLNLAGAGITHSVYQLDMGWTAEG
jgi:hypothetical protein